MDPKIEDGVPRKVHSESTRPSLPEGGDAISRTLVSARATATPLAGFPGGIPDSMAGAYAIQSASIARWADTVGGWKVGLLSSRDQERFAAERLMGPIFQSQIHDVSTGSRNVMPIYVGGFAAIEAEFVFKLADTIESGAHTRPGAEITDFVAGLHIGAEIASSPMAMINELGPAVVASDFGNNAGLLLGPAIPRWQSIDPADLPARVIIDGKVAGEASAAAIPGGPLAALRFVVSLAAARGITLPAGSLISTGAVTGIHDVNLSSESRVEFGDYGWFEVTFVPMADQQ